MNKESINNFIYNLAVITNLTVLIQTFLFVLCFFINFTWLQLLAPSTMYLLLLILLKLFIPKKTLKEINEELKKYKR